MAKPPRAFEFTLQFGAGIGSVDAATGVLRGVTVAEVGEALGHFAYVDPSGKIAGIGGLADAPDFPGTRRLPLCMDEASLDSVVTASAQMKRVKTREDHDDSIKSRAGFSESFRREGAKVVCDLNILDAYANRAVFIETAQKTPELIGLSGDFEFTAEISGDRALMRVTRVDAVDIVDKGALTHSGLFAIRPGVDIAGNSKSAQLMAKTPPPANDDADDQPDFAAFKVMCDAIAAYQAKHAEVASQVAEAMSAIKPVTVPTPPGAPAPAKSDNAMTELKAAAAAEASKAVTAAMVEFRKEMSALGLKPAAVPGAAPTPTPTPAPAAGPKTFLELKASIAKDRKLSPAKAAEAAMRENPALYAAHLREKGIINDREFQLAAAAK